jgi:hypothetical protein
MSAKYFIAVDPGAGGGIAWQLPDSTVGVQQMPETRRDCIDLLRELVVNGAGCQAVIEKVAKFIPDGGASQMFEYGRNVERCGCILETLGVRLVEVAPKVWQAGLHLGGVIRPELTDDQKAIKKLKSWQRAPKQKAVLKAMKAGDAAAKRDWKQKLRAEAQRLFPAVDVTLKTSDALLILEWARRTL